MAKINDIIIKFDELKPGLAADFTASVTRSVEQLIAKYEGELDSLYSQWSSDANTYRAVRSFIKYDSNSFRNRRAIGIETEYLAKQAAQYADDQIAAFTSKLVRKLGALDEVEIRGLNVNAFTFDIIGKLGGRRVRVEQNRIINVSPKGNLFHQWPALIYVDGRKTSEKVFKELGA